MVIRGHSTLREHSREGKEILSTRLHHRRCLAAALLGALVLSSGCDWFDDPFKGARVNGVELQTDATALSVSGQSGDPLLTRLEARISLDGPRIVFDITMTLSPEISYVTGSATVNSRQRAPDISTDSQGTTILQWSLELRGEPLLALRIAAEAPGVATVTALVIVPFDDSSRGVATTQLTVLP